MESEADAGGSGCGNADCRQTMVYGCGCDKGDYRQLVKKTTQHKRKRAETHLAVCSRSAADSGDPEQWSPKQTQEAVAAVMQTADNLSI